MTGTDETIGERLDRLERRVRVLEDERSLLDLLARYSFTADLGLAREFAELFVEDGVYDLSDDPKFRHLGVEGRLVGRAALVAFMGGRTMAPTCRAQHHANGPLVFQIDGDRAAAVGYSVTFTQREGEAGVFQSQVANLGYNLWTFARTGGPWRIVSRTRLEAGSTAIPAVLDGAVQGRDLLGG